MKTSTQCPHCQATLTLKNPAMVGKKVACPQCQAPFVVRPAKSGEADPPQKTSGAQQSTADDRADDEAVLKSLPPVKRRKKKRSAADRAAAKAPEPSTAMKALSAAFWLNAHLATAFCLYAAGSEFVWMVTHWDEVYAQAGLGRFAVRQLSRPLFIIITACIVWFQGVLPREIGMRRAVALYGIGYLLLFGLLGLIIALVTQRLFDDPVHAVRWSVIYLGLSLIVFSAWGYPPETNLQRAERLTSYGRYNEALTAANLALQEDPDDRDALELQRTLRQMMRHG